MTSGTSASEREEMEWLLGRYGVARAADRDRFRWAAAVLLRACVRETREEKVGSGHSAGSFLLLLLFSEIVKLV